MRPNKVIANVNDVIVLGDFAENYQFLVQGELQSYHQGKIITIIDGDGNIQHNSLCFISDDNKHDTNFVYKMQRILVDYLKENLPVVHKIFYFSDGCAKQHKNC